jgi:hypothetical protein
MSYQVARLDRSPWLRILAPLLAGLAMAAGLNEGRAEPARQSVYLLSDSDGYGLAECITQKRDCARIVADSWCEAHGHGPATAFGSADLTGAISKASSESTAGAATVTCAD